MNQERIRLANYRRPVTAPAGGATATSPCLRGDEVASFLPGILPFVETPTLTTGQLPNGETLTYTLLESSNSDLSSPTNSTVMGVQTGAGGIGAASAIFSARLKLAGGQYLGMKVTASALANVAGLAIAMNMAVITDL